MEVNDKIEARIIAISYSTHQVFLSTVPTVMNLLETVSIPDSIGSIHKDGTVLTIDNKYGMLVDKNTYVMNNNIEKKFNLNDKNITYRIIGYDLLDDLILASTLQSILSSEIITLQDALPGRIITAIVHHITSNAIYLTIGSHVFYIFFLFISS